MIFLVKHENTVMSFNTGAECFIFNAAVNNDFHKKHSHKQLQIYVSLVYECYIKDDNPTPLGDLCDFMAKYWKSIKKLSRSEILSKFYDWL